VAFFKNLFGGRDARYFIDKADRKMAEGRFAEARGFYGDALEKLGIDDSALREMVMRRQGEAGDALAVVNLEEAEHCLNGGEIIKAQSHLDLAREYAQTPETCGRVEQLARCLARPDTPVTPASSDGETGSSCACTGSACAPPEPLSEPPAATDGHLSPEERFELMTAALPEDLPRRYRALGARFAEGYLLAHDGFDEAAARLLGSLSLPAAQDIILYELAIIRHRQGDIRDCESLLRQALRANDRNPLCYLALVDLCVGTDRPEEALSLLDTMIAVELLPAQALMIKGDIMDHLGREEQALESYACLLESPHKKEAATKIIPILEKLGRGDEARQVFTRYVKGCC
jgi:tetratricopeptide (TPR) repeat protein